MPLVLCTIIFVALFLYVCIDYSGAMKMLEELTEYIKEKPYEAIGILTLLYIVVVLTILPITPVHLMVAYAYCKVYDSFWLGFAMATSVIFVGCLLGAILAILLARFVIADYIKTKIEKSRSIHAKKV